jgi:hypothetical protein
LVFGVLENSKGKKLGAWGSGFSIQLNGYLFFFRPVVCSAFGIFNLLTAAAAKVTIFTEIFFS